MTHPIQGTAPTLLFSTERRRLGADVAELRHIGEMLVAQTNANHVASREARSAAVALVRQKVDEVEDRRAQLETLIEGRKAPSEEPILIREGAAPSAGSIRIGDNESYL
ncbi:unnamed protein product, partial [Mesorhabditis spiculigera]